MIWVYLAILQALLLALMIAYLNEVISCTGFSALAIVYGTFIMFGTAPFMLTGLMNTLGGTVVTAGKTSGNPRLVIIGNMMMGKGAQSFTDQAYQSALMRQRAQGPESLAAAYAGGANQPPAPLYGSGSGEPSLMAKARANTRANIREHGLFRGAVKSFRENLPDAAFGFQGVDKDLASSPTVTDKDGKKRDSRDYMTGAQQRRMHYEAHVAEAERAEDLARQNRDKAADIRAGRRAGNASHFERRAESLEAAAKSSRKKAKGQAWLSGASLLPAAMATTIGSFLNQAFIQAIPGQSDPSKTDGFPRMFWGGIVGNMTGKWVDVKLADGRTVKKYQYAAGQSVGGYKGVGIWTAIKERKTGIAVAATIIATGYGLPVLALAGVGLSAYFKGSSLVSQVRDIKAGKDLSPAKPAEPTGDVDLHRRWAKGRLRQVQKADQGNLTNDEYRNLQNLRSQHRNSRTDPVNNAPLSDADRAHMDYLEDARVRTRNPDGTLGAVDPSAQKRMAAAQHEDLGERRAVFQLVGGEGRATGKAVDVGDVRALLNSDGTGFSRLRDDVHELDDLERQKAMAQGGLTDDEFKRLEALRAIPAATRSPTEQAELDNLLDKGRGNLTAAETAELASLQARHAASDPTLTKEDNERRIRLEQHQTNQLSEAEFERLLDLRDKDQRGAVLSPSEKKDLHELDARWDYGFTQTQRDRLNELNDRVAKKTLDVDRVKAAEAYLKENFVNSDPAHPDGPSINLDPTQLAHVQEAVDKIEAHMTGQSLDDRTAEVAAGTATRGGEVDKHVRNNDRTAILENMDVLRREGLAGLNYDQMDERDRLRVSRDYFSLLSKSTRTTLSREEQRELDRLYEITPEYHQLHGVASDIRSLSEQAEFDSADYDATPYERTLKNIRDEERRGEIKGMRSQAKTDAESAASSGDRPAMREAVRTEWQADLDEANLNNAAPHVAEYQARLANDTLLDALAEVRVDPTNAAAAAVVVDELDHIKQAGAPHGAAYDRLSQIKNEFTGNAAIQAEVNGRLNNNFNAAAGEVQAAMAAEAAPPAPATPAATPGTPEHDAWLTAQSVEASAAPLMPHLAADADLSRELLETYRGMEGKGESEKVAALQRQIQTHADRRGGGAGTPLVGAEQTLHDDLEHSGAPLLTLLGRIEHQERTRTGP
ncbi:Uncharacterised protein [uncultured archaeon]|nr:Uncharacterised protein [uncultured archaeon]